MPLLSIAVKMISLINYTETNFLKFIKNTSTATLTDQELIAAYKKSSDMNFLGAVYLRYMELVFGVCLKYFKDAEKAKDAVMDIYLELCSKLLHHEVDNFKPWLHVVARNHCLMQLRSPKNLKLNEFNADFMQLQQTSHLENEAFENEAYFIQLEQCLEILPEDQRQSIRLFYLQKKCYNEIAVITGYQWNKVRSYIQNGKRNLKQCLEANNIFDK